MLELSNFETLLRLFSFVPPGYEVGIREPDYRTQQGLYGIVHMLEIDMCDVVAGLMIVGVQSITGNGLCDDALLGEDVIIGAPKEILGGMRIGDEVGAVFRELGAEIRTIPAG